MRTIERLENQVEQIEGLDKPMFDFFHRHLNFITLGAPDRGPPHVRCLRNGRNSICEVRHVETWHTYRIGQSLLWCLWTGRRLGTMRGLGQALFGKNFETVWKMQEDIYVFCGTRTPIREYDPYFLRAALEIMEVL